MGKAELKIEIDEALLARAREAGVDIEPLVEDALRAALPAAVTGIAAAAARQALDPVGAEARAKQWAERNADAIKAYGERIEREGCFGEEWRNW
jgi:antitoxin CcdA